MKKLTRYFNSILSKQEEEVITKTLFDNHFDKDLKEKWERTLAIEYGVLPNKKNNINRYYVILRISAVAAAILLCVFLGNLYQPFSQTNIGIEQFVDQQLFEPYIALNIRKGITIENHRSKANNAYASKNYTEAIKEYKKIISSKLSIIDDYFYCGLSHLYLEKPEKAIPLFQKAITLDHSHYIKDKEPIRWYLSLAYIKNQQLKLAENELEILANINLNPKLKENVNTLLFLIKK